MLLSQEGEGKQLCMAYNSEGTVAGLVDTLILLLINTLECPTMSSHAQSLSSQFLFRVCEAAAAAG